MHVTFKDMRSYAAELAIPGRSGMTKIKILEAIYDQKSTNSRAVLVKIARKLSMGGQEFKTKTDLYKAIKKHKDFQISKSKSPKKTTSNTKKSISQSDIDTLIKIAKKFGIKDASKMKSEKALLNAIATNPSFKKDTEEAVKKVHFKTPLRKHTKLDQTPYPKKQDTDKKSSLKSSPRPGLKSLNKTVKIVSPFKDIPKKFEHITESCEMNKDWTIRKKIGEGSYGSAYITCKAGNCNYVLKKQVNNENFKNEVKALWELNNWKHSPRIYVAWTCGDKGYIVMDKVLISKAMAKKIPVSEYKKVIKQLEKRGWIHLDTHIDNVGYGKDNSGNVYPILLDYGVSHNIGKMDPNKGHIGKLTENKLTEDDLRVVQEMVLYSNFGNNKDRYSPHFKNIYNKYKELKLT